MIITEALLAQYARVVDDNLDVLGGFVRTIKLDPDASWVELFAVVLTSNDAIEPGRTQLVSVTVTDAGHNEAEVYRAEMPGWRFYILPLRFGIPSRGTYTIRISVGASRVDLSLDIP